MIGEEKIQREKQKEKTEGEGVVGTSGKSSSNVDYYALIRRLEKVTITESFTPPQTH